MTKHFSLIGSLFVGLLGSSLAQAHDLKYTLKQDGAIHVQTCQSKELGAKVDVFAAENSAQGYVVLSNVDEDAQVQREYLTKVTIRAKGHDLETYRNAELTVELASVGEGSLPGLLRLSSGGSALKVWLKTYGQGFNLKSAKLECETPAN